MHSVEIFPVHLLRAEQQIGKRQFQQGFDFVHAPTLRNSEGVDRADEFDSLGIHKFERSV